MFSMKYLIFILSLLSLLVACTPSTTPNTSNNTPTQQGQQVASLAAMPAIPFEKRWIVAVTDFEVPRANVSIEGYPQAQTTLNDLGKNLADTFSSQAFESQQFRVTERSALASILEELSLAASGAVDASSASQIGQITGAELLAFGTVNNLSVTSKSSEVLGVGSTTVQISATINVRLVDTATAELRASANGAAQSNHQSLTVDIHRDFQNILLGSSTGDIHAVLQAAVQQSIQQLVTQLPRK